MGERSGVAIDSGRDGGIDENLPRRSQHVGIFKNRASGWPFEGLVPVNMEHVHVCGR